MSSKVVEKIPDSIFQIPDIDKRPFGKGSMNLWNLKSGIWNSIFSFF